MSIRIRPMEQADVDPVHESGIQVEAFATSHVEAEQTPFWPKDRLRAWVDSDSDVLLVAEDSSADPPVVGYFLSHYHPATGVAYIENVFVADSHRRRGLGHRLVEQGVEHLTDHGARYLSALTKPENEAMQALLEDLDFNRGHEFVWMDRVVE